MEIQFLDSFRQKTLGQLHHLPVPARPEGAPGWQVDGITDEMYRAIGKDQVDAAIVIAARAKVCVAQVGAVHCRVIGQFRMVVETRKGK